MMENAMKYMITILVTLEQEHDIVNLFHLKNWTYVKINDEGMDPRSSFKTLHSRSPENCGDDVGPQPNAFSGELEKQSTKQKEHSYPSCNLSSNKEWLTKRNGIEKIIKGNKNGHRVEFNGANNSYATSDCNDNKHLQKNVQHVEKDNDVETVHNVYVVTSDTEPSINVCEYYGAVQPELLDKRGMILNEEKVQEKGLSKVGITLNKTCTTMTSVPKCNVDEDTEYSGLDIRNDIYSVTKKQFEGDSRFTTNQSTTGNEEEPKAKISSNDTLGQCAKHKYTSNLLNLNNCPISTLSKRNAATIPQVDSNLRQLKREDLASNRKDTTRKQTSSTEKKNKTVLKLSKRLLEMSEENLAFKEQLDNLITETSLIVQEMKDNAYMRTCCMCNKEFCDDESFITHAQPCLMELKERNNGHFKCKSCGRVYEQAFTLLSHRLSQICKPGMLVREGDSFVCQFCGEKFPAKRKSEFALHLMMHRNQKTHICTFCGRSFMRWTALRDHHRSHTGEKPFICRFCPLNFGSAMGRRNHELTKHSDPKSYICEVCGASFALKDRLATHLKNVHTKKRYKCDVCNKELKSKISVNSHKKAHANIKSHVCDICGKAFLLATALNLHMKRHRNERSYFCELCQKGFYKRQALDVHMRVHTGDKPYSCVLCTYRCAVKGNMNKHMKSCHPNMMA